MPPRDEGRNRGEGASLRPFFLVAGRFSLLPTQRGNWLLDDPGRGAYVPLLFWALGPEMTMWRS